MANETTIDKETARRLLLIFSLEGDVKREWKEWALGIIHQIPGYAGITMEEAVRDDFLREVFVAIAAEQLSSTTPKELETLIKDAQKRKAALKSAKETGEKRVEEFIEAAEKAAKTKAQIEVSPVTPEAPSKEEALPKEGFSIKVSQSFVKEFSSVGKAAAYAPLKVVSFFSPPPSLRGAVQDATATSLALTDLAAKARAARNIEEKRVFQALHDALEEAQYSAVVRLNLPMRLASITGVRVTLLSGQELGLPQGQAAALLQTSAGKPSLLGTIGKGLGQRLLGQASGKLVKGFLGKAAAKLGAAAAGAPAGPPGIIAGALASFAPDLLSWITRNGPKVAISIGAFLFGTGFVFQSPILMAGGGMVGLGGLVAGAGGVGPALSKAGGFASSAISGITSLTVASIATPLIVALISIPVLVAIILFIINSGAYLVPPKAPVFTGILESPYIAVDKKASPDCLNRVDPAGKPCLPLPGEVTYEIEIKAKKGTLTNIKVENSYQVFGKGTGTITPPKIEIPQTISPTQSFRFSYKLRFDKNLDDSVVYDTLKITADAPEQKGAEASDVASVIIGNPPASSCPILGGTISTGSYNGTREVGHGSNPYWNGPAGDDCGYDIPAFTGCYSPTSSTDPDSDNTCQGKPRACSYYGFAADVRRGGAGDIVQLPSIFGKSINWTFQNRVTIRETAWGWGYSFTGSDGKNNYSLYLGHLNQTTPPQTAPSGTIVGTLYPGLTPPHVHIELQINGQWVRPDFLCGGVGP